MSIKVYVNTSNKRAETSALLDSGATKNFITTHYANWLRLPIKQLPRARKVCNVDGTSNKQGNITHFTDLEVQMGAKRVKMRFFLTDLGEQKVILGYPWFAANNYQSYYEHPTLTRLSSPQQKTNYQESKLTSKT